MDKQRENIENEEIQDCNMENDNTLPNEELSEAVELENKEDKDQKKSGLFGKKDKKSKQSTSVDLPEEELNRLQTENAELQDKFLRLYSEFDNYRKRTQKEKTDIIQHASESLIVSFLSVIDDMERALKYNEDPNADPNAIKEGQVLIFQKMNTILKQKGLNVIDTKEARFDTDYHEAISIIPATTEEDKGKIVEEVEKGYMLNAKVIRFSKVIIYQ